MPRSQRGRSKRDLPRTLGLRKAVDNDARFLSIIMFSQRIPQIHCHILLQRRACSGGAPSRRISGEQANKGRKRGAKVIIGTKVTGWRGCEEMIRTVSSLASRQTKSLVKIPLIADGGFVANFRFLSILGVTKTEYRG